MRRTLYMDCFSGVSGDMMLGALLDLGLPAEALEEALGSLSVEHGGISLERVLRAGISATKFRLRDGGAAQDLPSAAEDRRGHRHEPAVHAHAAAHAQSHAHGPHEPPGHRDHDHAHGDHAHGDPAHHDDAHRHDGPAASHGHGQGGGHHHHSLAEIERAIGRSALSPGGKARAVRMFHRLAEAEAAIHDMPLDRIHLHEVGALDSIVDIVGTVFGMEWLGAEEVVASPLNVGSGTVRCAHGTYPVPAPATARLLRGVPVYSGAVAAELVTPTGALIVTEYARRYGTLPSMTIERIGYGAGDRDVPGHPNVLRLMLGESVSGGSVEPVLVLECEIDDMNPQLFGPLMERLHAAGALDVFYVPVMMKKNRPGTLVTVIAPPARREAITSLLFAETTTIGIRGSEVQRERLEREIRTVETPAGLIRVKVAMRDGRILNVAPEFEDCARAAAERGLPIKDVQALATKAWLDALRG